MSQSNAPMPSGKTEGGSYDTPAPTRANHAQVWAALGYLGLALLVTFPAAAHFSTQVPGDLIADRDQNLWNLWWVLQALAHPANPFHTDLLYYPYGASLYYHTLGLPQGIIGLLPQLIWGLPASYNSVLLAAFTLSGYGAFRLALFYTGRPLASFLGGVVFAFTPYTLDALKGQLEVLSVQWMPFYTEAWLRALTAEGRKRIALAALAGLFFALTALSSLYYAVYLALFTGAYLVYAVANRNYELRITNYESPEQSPPKSRTQNPKLAVTAITAVTALILLSPLLWGLVRDHGNPRLEVRADPAHRLAHSADLLSFFAPPHDHPLVSNASLTPGVDEPPVHDYLSLGYAALALALLGAVTAWRRHDTRFWVLLALGALLLSMGPQLQVGRNLTGIPLPFRLIENLPGVDAIAKPERFVVLVRMCMGVLAAWGGVYLLDRFSAQTRLRSLATFAVVLALLLVELPIHPRYAEPFMVPGAFNTLAQQPHNGGLMELPFATQQGQVAGERMLAQSVHGFPIMAGYLSRNYNSPIIDSCSPFWGFISPRDVPHADTEIAAPLVVDRLSDVLGFYKIPYIALYSRYAGSSTPTLSQEDSAAYEGILAQVAERTPLSSDESVTIYRTRTADPASAEPSFHIGAGWYAPEQANGQPFRWLKGGIGSLCVFAPHTATASLLLEGTSFSQDRPITVQANGKSLYNGILPSGGRFQAVRTEPVEWPAGVTQVEINAGGQATTPRSADPNLQDDRPLTGGFRAVHLERDAQK